MSRGISRGWQHSAQSSVWFLFRRCFSALRPEIKHFRIHKKCYFPVKFVVSLIIFVNVVTFVIAWSRDKLILRFYYRTPFICRLRPYMTYLFPSLVILCQRVDLGPVTARGQTKCCLATCF